MQFSLYIYNYRSREYKINLTISFRVNDAIRGWHRVGTYYL